MLHNSNHISYAPALQGLPGVGLERAGRLLESFGSVEAVVSASSSELQSVYGIGKGVADKIKWAVSEQVHPFGMESNYDSGFRTKKYSFPGCCK